jgi:hypothetical protein
MKTEAEIKSWVSQLDAGRLMGEYDTMNHQRAKLAAAGRHLPGDDLKRIERLTMIINLMRDRINADLEYARDKRHEEAKIDADFDRMSELTAELTNAG